MALMAERHKREAHLTEDWSLQQRHNNRLDNLWFEILQRRCVARVFARSWLVFPGRRSCRLLLLDHDLHCFAFAAEIEEKSAALSH